MGIQAANRASHISGDAAFILFTSTEKHKIQQLQAAQWDFQAKCIFWDFQDFQDSSRLLWLFTLYISPKNFILLCAIPAALPWVLNEGVNERTNCQLSRALDTQSLFSVYALNHVHPKKVYIFGEWSHIAYPFGVYDIILDYSIYMLDSICCCYCYCYCLSTCISYMSSKWKVSRRSGNFWLLDQSKCYLQLVPVYCMLCCAGLCYTGGDAGRPRPSERVRARTGQAGDCGSLHNTLNPERYIHQGQERWFVWPVKRTRLPWLWLCGVFTRFCSCSSYFLLLLLLAVAHLTIWPFATLFRLATINTQLVFPAIAAIQPALWEKHPRHGMRVYVRVFYPCLHLDTV